MPFATGPVLTYVGLGRYRTVGPTVYVGASDVITIPSDFGTDLATVPRIFWAVLPPSGVYERAAVLHDWACTEGIASGLVSSIEADGLFRRVARECGVGAVTRWLLWWGVRVGALTNPARRAGWCQTAPAVAAITAALAAAVAAAGWAVDTAAHWLIP